MDVKQLNNYKIKQKNKCNKYCPKCNQLYTQTTIDMCGLCGKQLIKCSENQVKCPTCQSTNIKKISSAKKATHGIMFGIFSKTAFSQFECRNCGYKW